MEGNVEPGCGVDASCAVVGPGEVTLISEHFVIHIILFEADPWSSNRFLSQLCAKTQYYQTQEARNHMKRGASIALLEFTHELADSLRLLGDSIWECVQLGRVKGHEGRCGRSAANHELANLMLLTIA